MNLPEFVRSLHLTPVQIGVVVVAGVITLIIGFKAAKLAFKLVFCLIALALLGLGVLWLLGHV